MFEQLGKKIKGLETWQKIASVFVPLSVIIAVSVVLSTMFSEAGYLSEVSNNRDTITELNKKLAAEKDIVPVEVAAVTDYLDISNSMGERMAKLQTGFVGEYESDALDILSDLVASEGNQWRGRWIFGATQGYTWQFCHSYDCDGETVPMLWIAVTPDNQILAYAKGTWQASDGLIHSIELVTTKAGYDLAAHDAYMEEAGATSGSNSETTSSAETTDTSFDNSETPAVAPVESQYVDEGLVPTNDAGTVGNTEANDGQQ